MARHKIVTTTATVMEALDQAQCEVEALMEEMTSWRDGMEEKLSHTDKYERVSEAADTLENADLDNAIASVETAIAELAGHPAKAGCKFHILGTPCRRCGWKGKPRQQFLPKPVREVYDPPIKIEGWPGLVVAKVEYGRNLSNRELFRDAPGGVWTAEGELTQEQIDAKLREARNCWMEKVREYRESVHDSIPQTLPDEPAVEGVEALVGIGETQASWQQYRPSRSRSLSRADRLSDAVSAATAAVEAMHDKLGEPVDGEDDRVSDLREAIDEVSNAIESLDGIEFPGMYG